VRRATVGVVEGVMSAPEMVLENYNWVGEIGVRKPWLGGGMMV